MVLEFDADWPRAYGDELVGGPGADLLDAGLDPRADGNYAVRDRVNYAGARHALSLDLSGADRAGESGTASVGGVTDRIVWHPLLSVRGTAQGDRMVGAQGPDLLFGGPGSDRLEGRGGWDVLRPDGTGARDADVVLGGRGADDIVALGGADSLSGGDGDDWVTAQRAGARMLDGGAGNDQLTRTSEHASKASQAPSPTAARAEIRSRSGPGRPRIRQSRRRGWSVSTCQLRRSRTHATERW